MKEYTPKQIVTYLRNYSSTVISCKLAESAVKQRGIRETDKRRALRYAIDDICKYREEIPAEIRTAIRSGLVRQLDESNFAGLERHYKALLRRLKR